MTKAETAAETAAASVRTVALAGGGADVGRAWAAEAFDDALGRGFADQREARREAGEVALAWAVVGGIVAAVSGAQCDAAGGADGP